MRKDMASNEIRRVAMICGSYIKLNDKLLLKAKSPVQWIDISREEIIVNPKTEVDIDLIVY